MPEHDKIEVLVESINRYVKTNCELIKLEATERTSVIGSCLISNLLIGLVGILIIFFISLGASFYISYRIGDNYSGFIIVAGFYFILGFILMIGRRTLIERPLRDKIIRKIFSRN
jgi:energy-coupling factor transporter transmembrane protein EcfT